MDGVEGSVDRGLDNVKGFGGVAESVGGNARDGPERRLIDHVIEKCRSCDRREAQPLNHGRGHGFRVTLQLGLLAKKARNFDERDLEEGSIWRKKQISY